MVLEAVERAAAELSAVRAEYMPESEGDLPGLPEARLTARAAAFTLNLPVEQTGRSKAVAELSLLPQREVDCLVQGPNAVLAQLLEPARHEAWYYFHRLLVPESVRGRGWGGQLMALVALWADLSEANICNELNPYGPEPYMTGLAKLKHFYGKWGFVEVGEAAMIRLHKAIQK